MEYANKHSYNFRNRPETKLYSVKDIIRCYNNTLTIHAVQKHKTTTGDLSVVPTALALKYWTEKPVWVKQ